MSHPTSLPPRVCQKPSFEIKISEVGSFFPFFFALYNWSNDHVPVGVLRICCVTFHALVQLSLFLTGRTLRVEMCNGYWLVGGGGA
jgi:hypothetical protein